MIDTSAKKITVIGDVMLDRYWQGDSSRISPEAPVPIVRIDGEEARPGGAGNVALNLAALGVQVRLFGLVGEDESASVLAKQLEQFDVDARLVIKPELRTITKLRVLSRHQQLIRLDHEQDFSRVDHSDFLECVLQSLNQADLVILSDYNKGTLAHICPFVIDRCRQLSIPVLVDPKGNHRRRYQNATLLTPNMHEFQQMVGACDSEQMIQTHGRELIKSLNLEALLITRSEKGMTLIESDEVVNIPSRVRQVFDVTGAGDTVIAVFSAACVAGERFHEAAILANRAAGIVVGKLGAATVNLGDLKRDGAESVFARKVISEEDLLVQLRALRESKQVVMSNGCFDILQPGHVLNLEQCKALGDLLIVAVNTDASVRRLKGEHRPINSLGQRMQVLAGLSSVDYLVAFEEDTPSRIISAILPDVLAKGGDYQLESIAGADAVLAAGGRVEIIDLFGGFSSTGMIEKIRSLPD